MFGPLTDRDVTLVILARWGKLVEEVAKRRGRPPATDSAETWYTILRCSRELFAHRGYSAVTNKELATAAGITTGALVPLRRIEARSVRGGPPRRARTSLPAIRGSDGTGGGHVHRQVRGDPRGVARAQPGGPHLHAVHRHGAHRHAHGRPSSRSGWPVPWREPITTSSR